MTSVGCDKKKYRDLREKLEDTHRGKVQTLIEHWEQAEKRYKLLKASDEDQAASSISGEFAFLFPWHAIFVFSLVLCYSLEQVISCLAVRFKSLLIVIRDLMISAVAQVRIAMP